MPDDDKRKGDVCDEYGLSIGNELKALQDEVLEAAGLSELFKAMADETRTRILHLLSLRELCVCDLAAVLEMSLPAVSHHLRLLKMMRLVKNRRDGKQVYYALDDSHVVDLITVAREHFREEGRGDGR